MLEPKMAIGLADRLVYIAREYEFPYSRGYYNPKDLAELRARIDQAHKDISTVLVACMTNVVDSQALKAARRLDNIYAAATSSRTRNRFLEETLDALRAQCT